MFREIRISSLGLPQKLSVPSERAGFECQQKQQEQLLCAARPLPLAWRASRGQNPPAGAQGGQQTPNPNTGTLTAPKVTTKEQNWEPNFFCGSKLGGKRAEDESGSCSDTKRAEPAPNTHQETGSKLSTASSPDLEIC